MNLVLIEPGATAVEHSWTTTDDYEVVGERAIRIGADGARLVGELVPMEIAAIKGISVTAATWLIRDVLNLEARHPVLWDAGRAGRVAPPSGVPAHNPQNGPDIPTLRR